MAVPAIKDIAQKLIMEAEHGSAKQMFLGASAGFVTGMFSARIGKAAALAIGGGIILVQIANERKYITVHWDKVNKKVDQVVGNAEDEEIVKDISWSYRMKNFAMNNTALTSFFIGGFLIGLAS